MKHQSLDGHRLVVFKTILNMWQNEMVLNICYTFSCKLALCESLVIADDQITCIQEPRKL